VNLINGITLRKVRLEPAGRLFVAGLFLLSGSFVSAQQSLAQKVTDDVAVSTRCWDFPTESAPQSGLAGDAANVYFAAAGGKVTAIETSTGQAVWNAELGGQVISNLLVHRSNIIAVTSTVESPGKPRTASLRSVSKATGIVDWTIAIDPSNKYFLGISPNGIIAVSESGRVELHNTQDGTSIWKRSDLDELAAEPHFYTKYAIIPVRSGKTYTLSAVDGSSLSIMDTMPNIESQDRVSDKWIISGDDRGNLVANNVMSGKRQWTFKAGAKWSYIAGTKYGVAAISADNFVYMLSADRGNVIWKKRLPGRISGSPALSESYAIIASYGEDKAYMIDLKSGRIMNQIPLGENRSLVESPIMIAEDSIAAATNSGISLWRFGTCGENKKAALNVPPR
jgi:outer membrane protein assembly factor BamB